MAKDTLYTAYERWIRCWLCWTYSDGAKVNLCKRETLGSVRAYAQRNGYAVQETSAG